MIEIDARKHFPLGMPAADFLRGCPVAAGDILGSALAETPGPGA